MKLNDLSAINDRIEGGAWVSNLRNLPGVSLKVRGDMNTDYERRAAELFAATPETERTKPEVAERIEITLLQETVLLGWDGIDEPFNEKNAALALKVPAFRRGVETAARVVGALGRASLEADAKN